MPELKRLFLKGRMNKDLDERLVPNGEYRDALNIQVGSSEDSDVGAIENILGNQVAKLKKAFPATDWALNSETANYYGLPLDAECIGAIKDDINDRIFWFITSSTVDCIAEYTNKYGVVRAVLVDTQGILNFSKNKLITGINLIDDYLFFTDDNSEPKRIDVTKFGSINFTTHSRYEGRDFIEPDITVIKKSPLNAPTFELSNSLRGGNIETSALYNFGEYYLTMPPAGTGGIINSVGVGWEYTTLSTAIPLNPNIETVYQVGDTLQFEADAPESHLAYDTYIIEVTILGFFIGNKISVRVDKIPPLILDEAISWRVRLIEGEAIFEDSFPRFAYRWKYYDNQYSCFSPFTEVAFLPGLYRYNAKEGYNQGMENQTRSIALEITEAAPIDVVEIDILYKKTNDPTIYVVETLTPKNFPELESFNDISSATPFYFDVTNELLYKVVESNQLLRPWDNVPRLAKAQELVANRIVYGNYLQNYTWDNDLLKFLSASIISDDLSESGGIGQASVKSLRKYQIGVVFKDKYGRETPIFTNNNLQFKVPIELSGSKNIIKIQRGQDANGDIAPYVPAPSWATHFKYFVKVSENEYYNLAVDRIYPSEDPAGAWLSFPSADRNKIMEDDYIILKKGTDSDTGIFQNNKYKILDIKNEAPEEIKKEKLLEYEEIVAFGNAFPNPSASVATPQAGFTPTEDSNRVVFYDAGGLLNLKNALKVNGYVRFVTGSGEGTQFYKITSINTSNNNDDPEAIQVYFDKRFTNDVNFLYTSGVLSAVTTQVYGYQEREPGASQFEGRFFVKVNTDDLLLENVSNVVSDYLPYGGAIFGSNKYSFGNMIIFGAGAPRGYVTNPGTVIGDLCGYKAGGSGDNPSSDILSQNWDIILERKIGHTYDQNFWSAMNSVGTKIKLGGARYINDPSDTSGDDTVYKVTATTTFIAEPGTSQSYQRLYVRLKDINAGQYDPGGIYSFINPTFISDQPVFSETGYEVSIELVREENKSTTTSYNPAIFELKPRKQADLDIYYEASNAIEVAPVLTGWGAPHELSWSNCFAFGNGVESDRIRDDFNTPFIDSGTKASTVLEEPYKEERRYAGLIYSGLFNSNSGLNNLNQFIQAEKITKDLNPVYGSIQKLHTRDTNLVTLCEDKCLRILANKDALFNADGNTNLTSTNNVLGQAMPFNGEFGISKNPESFASYGYRAYFTDKKRGVVLRLSMDGITEISGKGMSDYFWDNLKAASSIRGSYDIYSDVYTLTLNNDTVCFKESSDGWPTRKSFIPEWGISLNSDYYTFKNGMIWSHDNENRNTFYEGTTNKSSVQLIFNDIPSKIKNFKTISYEGDNGWAVPLIQTDQQDGAVTTFLNKENIYYNYIRGLGDSWSNITQSGTLDLKQFAAQGIGNIFNARNADNTGDYTGNTTFTVTVKNDPLN